MDINLVFVENMNLNHPCLGHSPIGFVSNLKLLYLLGIFRFVLVSLREGVSVSLSLYTCVCISLLLRFIHLRVFY